MKLLIISDTHRDTQTLKKLALKHTDFDYYIHLGDYEIPEYLLSPFGFVKGNCDLLSEAPLSRDYETSIGIIHCEHGHHLPFNIKKYMIDNNYQILLSGHTHKRTAIEFDGRLILNPGSLTRPRDNNVGTYLILEIDDKTKKISYNFKELSLEDN